MKCIINHVLTPLDLTASDRMVKVAYQTGKIANFTEGNDGWKRSSMYSDYLRAANRIANIDLNRIFSA